MDPRATPSGATTPPSVPAADASGDRWSPAQRRVALALSALLAATFVVVYLWAVRSEGGQRADISLLVDLQELNPALGPAATALRPGLIVAGALACAALGVLAVVRRRWRSLGAAVTVVVVSVGSTWALKNLVLDRPFLGDFGYTVNTFPSGHVSGALALVVAAALLSPAWRSSATQRFFLLTLTVVAFAACFASLLEHVHRPSDVVGSVLLVGSASALVGAVFEPPLPRRIAPPG